MTDIINKTYSKLTVLKYVGLNTKNRPLYLCKCDCGTEKIILAASLKSGNTKSCGCVAKTKTILRNKKLATHNLSQNNRLYRIWKGFRSRCRDINNKYYKNYGGRGILVCKEWNEKFITFYNWSMNNGYKNDLSLDRIDNNGNYSPENCRWTTMIIQRNNTRINRYLIFNNKTYTLAEWSRVLKIHPATLKDRINRNNGVLNEQCIK